MRAVVVVSALDLGQTLIGKFIRSVVLGTSDILLGVPLRSSTCIPSRGEAVIPYVPEKSSAKLIKILRLFTASLI